MPTDTDADLVDLLTSGDLTPVGRIVDSSNGALLCSVEPVFGLVFAWMLLGEGLSVQKMVGAAVIVASCVVVAMGNEEPEVMAEPQGVVVSAF